MMDALRQDIRYGVRQLLRQRGSSLVAVLTLALGIGASTAIFSVIDVAMLRPLPYPDPEQLVELNVEIPQPDGRVRRPTPSMDDLRFWQKADDVFSAVAGWGSAFRGRIADGPEPERIEVLYITEDYLPMHGVSPHLGRGFSRDETQHGGPGVAMLGYGYWQSRYGGRREAVGETVRLDDEVATIVGVLPSWFEPDTPIVQPLRVPPDQFAYRGTGRVDVYARLRPGVTVEQARERLSARMAGEPLRDGSIAPVRVAVASRLEEATTRYRTTVKVIAGAVGLILLIACVNVAGLLLARGAARHTEMAVRASLGARRIRLIRQMLTESVVLALAGGTVGVLLAWLALDAIVANMPMSLPSSSPVSINLTVLGFTAALLLLTSVLFGLVPAVRLSRVRLNSALARGGRQQGLSLSRRGSQVLIAAEVALAVVLVAGAGLMLRSFARLTAVDLGFNPDRLMTMEVLPLDPDVNVHKAYYTSLVQRLRTIPGVTSVGLVDNFALGGGTAFTGVRAGGKSVPITFFSVLPGYFETIEARLRAGRLPTDADYASGLRGAVINETAAREMFPDGPAVGREFTSSGRNAEPWTVLGVIADLRHGGPLNTRGPQPQVFYPLVPDASDLNQAMLVVLRTSGRTPDLGNQLRGVAQSIGPRVLIERIRTGNDWFGDRVITPRRRTVLLSLLGGLGLVLALVGVFGMTAYAVARRTREIGVRLAFGARPGQVVRTMLRDSVWPIAIGTVAGIGGAMLATRVIESFLYETTPTDPATFAGVAAALAATGCLAALVPALRAARVDPASTLRTE
jgi:predicted permease